MSTDIESSYESLRTAIQSQPRRGRGRGCSPELKAEVLELVDKARRQGECIPQIAKKLGIGAASLYAWKQQAGRLPESVATDSPVIRPVMLTGPATTESTGIVLELQNGIRVVGLDQTSLVAVLKELHAGA